MNGREQDIDIYKKALEVLPMPVILVGADEHILFMNKLVDCLEKCLICRHIRRFAD